MKNQNSNAESQMNKPKTQIFKLNDNETNINKYDYTQNNKVQLSKYNIFTFFPKALVYQFMRLANVYFLVVAVLQSISLISPLTPVTAIGPLIFVLVGSLVREGWEDIKRHEYDNVLNNEIILKYSVEDNNWIEVKSQELRIGEIVVIKEDEVLPADIVVLDTNNIEGHCFVETSNLDGEKTLKKRSPNPNTIGLFNNAGIFLMKNINITGEITCDSPNIELYRFDAKADMTIHNRRMTLSYNQKNILLKGSRLKSSKWVVGFICYVGHDCKLIKNTKNPKNKLSVIENLVSKLVVGIIFFQILFCISASILFSIYYNLNVKINPMLPKPWESPSADAAITYFTYMMLLNTMIPISLIITLEFVKIFQGYFMRVDAGLYCKSKRISPKIGSVSINEELGQVTHIFSDKTGTLTNNKMKFRYCVIGDTAYEMTSKENMNPINTINNNLGTSQQPSKDGRRDNNNGEINFKGEIKNNPNTNENDVININNNKYIQDSYLSNMQGSKGKILLDSIDEEKPKDVFADLNKFSVDNKGLPINSKTNQISSNIYNSGNISNSGKLCETDSQRNNKNEDYLILDNNNNNNNNCINSNNIINSDKTGGRARNKNPQQSNFKKPAPSMSNPNLGGVKINTGDMTDNEGNQAAPNNKIGDLLDQNNVIVVDSKRRPNNHRELGKKHNTDCNKKPNIHFSQNSCDLNEYKKGKSYGGKQGSNDLYYDNLLFCNRPQSLKLSIHDLEQNFKLNERGKTLEANVVKVTNGYMSNRTKQQSLVDKNKYEGFILRSDDGEATIDLSDDGTVIHQFWLALTLANECIVEKKAEHAQPYIMNTGRVLSYNYTGMSPDDIELVFTCAKQGYELTYADHKSKRINFGDNSVLNKQFEVLQTLEFTSDRKRMSIIIRDDLNRILLYTKGADTVIFPKLHPFNDAHILEQNVKYTTNFSKQGYRTLSVAMKILSEQEYKRFENDYAKANLIVENKHKEIEKVVSTIEKDFYLIGSTVVEDQLQDQVPETIRDLRLAQIKIWMLTGDKIDTAYSIGLSCNLITPKMKTFFVHGEKGDSLEKLLMDFKGFVNHFDPNSSFNLIRSSSNVGSKQEKIIRNFRSNSVILKSMQSLTETSNAGNDQKIGDPMDRVNNNFAIVIDSIALTKIFSDKEHLEVFLNISLRAYAVICCRISPLQKSEIVKEVKIASEDVISLAVGDGGNDVSMILEANIGVGIFGEEGMRAVQASDFALGEFKLLRRLLLNNGRPNNIRISNMILYFFYKNFIITIIHYFYGFFSNFSGQTIFDDWFIALFNLVFTAAPLTVNAVFEHDLRSNDSIIIDKLLPFLYIETRDKPILTKTTFAKTLLRAIFQAAVIFFLAVYSQWYFPLNDRGDTPDLWYFSMNIFTTIIIVVSFRLLIQTRFWTYVLIIVMIITSWGAYGFAVVVSTYLKLFNSQGTSSTAFSSKLFHIHNILLASICFLIDFFFHSFNLNIVMGLSEKISHDLELIKEITENSMKKDRKESRTLKEGEEESIEKKSDFKKQKTLNNMKDFSDSNIKTFEDLPFYVAELLDAYIEYEGEINKQYEFKDNSVEHSEYVKTMLKVNKGTGGKKGDKKHYHQQQQQEQVVHKITMEQEVSKKYAKNDVNTYSPGKNNNLNLAHPQDLVNILEEDKLMNQESDKSKKMHQIHPLKGEKKYFESDTKLTKQDIKNSNNNIVDNKPSSAMDNVNSNNYKIPNFNHNSFDFEMNFKNNSPGENEDELNKNNSKSKGFGKLNNKTLFVNDDEGLKNEVKKSSSNQSSDIQFKSKMNPNDKVNKQEKYDDIVFKKI